MSRTLWFFLLALGLNSACTQIVVHLPSSRFVSPEVAGPWGKRLALGIAATHNVTVVSDASSRPPTIGPTTDEKSADLPFIAGLGLGPMFEIGFRYGFLVSTAMLTGKLQLLGHPAREAKEGDFSLALAAGYGRQNSSISGDQNGVFGPGGFNWNANETTTVQDYALVVGYRPTASMLIYGGPFYSGFSMSGTVHDDLSSDGTSPAVDYTLSQQGQATGLNGDLEFTLNQNKTISVTVELVYSRFQWTDLNSVNDLRTGLLGQFVF